MSEELIMLIAAELDAENNHPTDFLAPRRVWVWIRYPSKTIRGLWGDDSFPHDARFKPSVDHLQWVASWGTGLMAFVLDLTGSTRGSSLSGVDLGRAASGD